MMHVIKGALKRVMIRTSLPENVVTMRARKSVTCVAYHRILEPTKDDFPFDEEVVSATPEEFEREVRYLKSNFDVVSVPELLAGWHVPKALPRKPAVITFDDGYKDNYDVAFPILKEQGVPACFFVVTGLIGSSQVPWWDQVACCFKHSRKVEIESPFGGTECYRTGPGTRKRDNSTFINDMKNVPWTQALNCLATLREESGVDPGAFVKEPLFMTWSDLKELKKHGMTVGGHTRSHPNLARVDDTTLDVEIRGCWQELHTKLMDWPNAFSYPIGSPRAMSQTADRIIEKTGFRISFSYEHAYGSLKSRLGTYRVPRLHAEFGNDFEAFRLGMAMAAVSRNGQS